MGLSRPTLQGRAGYDPNGYGPGVNAPFGRSAVYFNGTRDHHGQDYFWNGPAGVAATGISTAVSKRVYAVVDGPVHHVYDSELGYGVWQQIAPDARWYGWHLASYSTGDGSAATTDTQIGYMGSTGTASGGNVHLHAEVRLAPYGSGNRVDPAPYFGGAGISHSATLTQQGDPLMSDWRLRSRTDDGVTTLALVSTHVDDPVLSRVWIEARADSAQGELWLSRLGPAVPIESNAVWNRFSDAKDRIRTVPTPAAGGDVVAAVKAAIADAFDDLEIPTPQISAADKKAIIDGAGAAAVKAIGAALSKA